MTEFIENSEVRRLLRQITERFSNLRPVMDEIGDIAVMGVRGNFEAQGRPRWKPHSSVTVARRGVGARVLTDRGMAGGLMGSIHHRAFDKKVEVSTTKEYAAMQHFGAKKGQFGTIAARIPAHTRGGHAVRAHTRQMKIPWGNVPARPFMHIVEADQQEMLRTLLEYLTEGE
jgi:phage gpG-like protein